MRHSTTSTELDIFHQTGQLRHSVSNTDSKRSTDRSTVTDRLVSRDLAMNTEPKITHSKDVGDFDVRIGDEDNEREYVEHREFTWNNTYARRTPLHSQSSTSERGLQTELHDTKREVGYVERPTKQHEDSVVEQRQEIITFRIPRPYAETTTEETYETTVAAEKQRGNRHFDETRASTRYEDNSTTLMKSETTEWTRSLGSASAMKSTMETSRREPTRSQSPEELVEESYEIVSTLTKPHDEEYLITSSSPHANKAASSSLTTRLYADTNVSKGVSSEDDSSYCEEWTVTEAKRKQDGQTVQTIIDRYASALHLVTALHVFSFVQRWPSSLQHRCRERQNHHERHDLPGCCDAA